jgi:hypothetical protein
MLSVVDLFSVNINSNNTTLGTLMYYNVVVVVYWRLINPLALLETVALAKALPSVALGKGPSVNFFHGKGPLPSTFLSGHSASASVTPGFKDKTRYTLYVK